MDTYARLCPKCRVYLCGPRAKQCKRCRALYASSKSHHRLQPGVRDSLQVKPCPTCLDRLCHVSARQCRSCAASAKARKLES